MKLQAVNKVYETVKTTVGKVIVGKDNVTELALIALLCGGHILLDDVPGTGKTVFAKTFAGSLSLDFKRVQCVPDMLPSDIVGVNLFDMKNNEFRFIKGPVFTNILLADEINRAMPKTQSGLLECMEEHQVSVEGVTYRLNEPFMVIATQNPVETKGTFDLPEAQLDRFLIKTSMGYPTHEENVEILSRKLNGIDTSGAKRVEVESVLDAMNELRNVYVHRDVMSYAASICEATRSEKNVVLGASPRAMIALLRVAQGKAALSGRDYALPDDVKYASIPVLAHRIVFQNSFLRRNDMGEELITKILEAIPVPSEKIEFSKR